MPEAAPVTRAETPWRSMRSSLGRPRRAGAAWATTSRWSPGRRSTAGPASSTRSSAVQVSSRRPPGTSTTYVDSDAGSRAVRDGGGDADRAGAGAARTGLADAPLVHPHRDVVRSPRRTTNSTLTPAGRSRRRTPAGRAGARRRPGPRRTRLRAGCPCRRGSRARRGLRRPPSSRPGLAASEVDGDRVAVDGHGLDAVAGRDRHRGDGSTRPSSARWRAKTRMPLPHISDAPPSALR